MAPKRDLMKKTFLKIVGYLSVALGFAGAFLPLVPTTPLLLLALWCFSRSSPKMNAWLLGNRMFGRYLKDYEQGRGIPKVVKVSSVIILWSSILFTTIVFTEAWWLRALLLLMALLVSVHILNLKTLLTGSKILVLIPTAMEGEKFAANLPPNVAVETIGIGPYRSAFNTYHHILRHRPRMAILAGIARNLSRKRIVHGREPVGKGRKRCRPGFVPAGRIPTQIRGAVGMPAHPAGDDILNGRQQHAQCRLGPVCRAQRRTTRKYGRRFVFLCLHTKRNAVPRTADHFEPRRRTVPRLGHRNRHGQPGPRPKPIDP